MAAEREELRSYVRDERPPDDAVIVVRGGPTTMERLATHVSRTHDAYVLDGAEVWGLSVFCALDDIGEASLDALLRRFSSYRVVHLPTVGRLRGAGLELLPTFRRPHYTLVLDPSQELDLAPLLDALGSAQRNPYHGPRPGRR